MNALETIKGIVKDRVAFINLAVEANCGAETYERLRHELTGMMICLKNVTEKHYSLNYDENGIISFGSYDDKGRWIEEQ